MNGEKLLARLSPSGVSIDFIYRDRNFGVNCETICIRREDVAAALSMIHLPKIAYDLAMFKYQADKVAEKAVKLWLIEQLIADQGVMRNEPALFEIIGCAKAIVFSICDGKKCKSCRGTGFAGGDTVAAKLCQNCSGDRTVNHSQRKLARVAEIPQTSWLRHWSSVCDKYSDRLAQFETITLARLAEQFRD